jgi:endonuclease YncB( thermonuclease family)
MFLRTPWLVPLTLLMLGVVGYTLVTSSRAQEGDAQFLLIRGAFVIIGKSPDGDSVRFIPDDASLLKKLKNNYRIKPSSDGSVQLRFEAIDTPEVHFGSDAQPLGVEARDALLKRMGFTNVRFTGKSETVTSSTPERLRGAILSQAAESNGRPISYTLLEANVGSTADGSRLVLTEALLKKTLNHAMLENGMAYLTVYSSTPEAQRAYFKRVASTARARKLGVWKVDKSARFTLESKASVSPGGQLVLPKLFRRSITYLGDIAKGKFSGTLTQWLVASQTSSSSQDDDVQIGAKRTKLSNLLEVKGKTVSFNADLLEVVFLEK